MTTTGGMRVEAAEAGQGGSPEPSRFDDILRLARAIVPAPGCAVVLTDGSCRLDADPSLAVRLRSAHDAVLAAGATWVSTTEGWAVGVPILVEGVICGTLCMVDPAAGAAPVPAVFVALADLAALAGERVAAQRLRRLRAVRERMWAAAADVPDVAAALLLAAQTCMEASGADLALVVRVAGDGEHIQVLNAMGRGALGAADRLAALRGLDMRMSRSHGGAALAGGRQVRIPDLSDPTLAGQPDIQVGLANCLSSAIITPLLLGAHRFALAIGFVTRPAAFDAMGDLLEGAALALRPLLRRMQAEETTELFRRALDAIPDVAIITEAEPIQPPGPRIVYVNPAFTQETGFTAEEAIGQTPRMLQGSGTTLEARRAIQQALAGWRPVRQEMLNYRKDGTPFWLELNIAPVTDSTGWYTHWVSVQRNTTERRAAEARQVEDAREMELLIAAMPGTLQRLRPTRSGGWRIVYSAPAMESLSGLRPEELVANRRFDYISAADRQLMRAHLDQALTEGHATAEIRLRRRDGEERILQGRMRANPRADGMREVIVIWSDVTAERALSAQMALTGRLASLGEMASGIAHELNQPLTAIVLLTDTLAALVQAGRAEAGFLVERLERIGAQALRAGKIIDNLRDFTRAHARENGAASLTEAVERTCSLVGALLTADGIAIEIDLPADLPPVYGEVTRIEQVLVNLLSNARDAQLQHPELPGRVRIVARHDAERVEVVVADTGGGINEAHLERLFDPFFTTKGPDRGTGLGLSICRSAMRQMRGGIAVRNAAGGAEFTLTFLRFDAAGSAADLPQR